MLVSLDNFGVFDQFDFGNVDLTAGSPRGVRLIFNRESFDAGPNDVDGAGLADHIIFDDSYSYATQLLTIRTQQGNDVVSVGTTLGYPIGSVRLEGGLDNDELNIGNVEGANAVGAGVFGGSGNDVISIGSRGAAIGFFGNSIFEISGGEGDDSITLTGKAFNLLGDNINVIDGGPGFDTFVWNGLFDLNKNTDQTGVDASNPPFPLEIGARNIEHLVVSSEAQVALRFQATDIVSITLGSTFDQSEFGLGLAGVGNTLFITAEQKSPVLDLTGWTDLGTSQPGLHSRFRVYAQDSAILAVDIGIGQVAPLQPIRLVVDRVAGATISLDALFDDMTSSATYEITDAQGQPVQLVTIENGRLLFAQGFSSGFSAPLQLMQIVDETRSTVALIDVISTDLSYNFVATTSPFGRVAIGDINSDGRLEFLGAVQNSDGTFSNVSAESLGLSSQVVSGRSSRDTRLVDLDNDGDLDIIGTAYAASVPGTPNAALIFENDGAGYFTEFLPFTALDIQGYGETVVVADFDNDGRTDVFLPYYHRNDPNGNEPAGSRLLLNQGAFDFLDATALWPVYNGRGTLSLKGFGAIYDENNVVEAAQALDFNRDGLIDLFARSHLFINQGGAFVDVNRVLGLPVAFEEGAVFFDWNNDGDLDFLHLSPLDGPSLWDFDAQRSRFDEIDILPRGSDYSEPVGISTGDLNGDGWTDILVSAGDNHTPRIFINAQGQSFTEYKSIAIDSLDNGVTHVIADLNGDGITDIVSPFNGGVRLGQNASAPSIVRIAIFGPNGERNQHGRMVQIEDSNSNSNQVWTRIVDGGSHYLSQNDYTLTFSGTNFDGDIAHVYTVEYPHGSPVRLSFTVQSGHEYEIFASAGNISARVMDTTAGTSIPFARTYGRTIGDDVLNVVAPGPVQIMADAGDDTLSLEFSAVTSADTVTVDGGSGADLIEAAISQQSVALDVLLSGGEGDDIIVSRGNTIDVLEGGEGNDLLDGGFGADVLTGGHGNDVYVVDDRGDVVVELSDGGVDTVRASLSYILGADVERLTLLGADNFAAKGNALANVIEGNVGNNYIDGAAGADVMKGGKGNDIYVVGDAEDSIVELVGEGADHVQAFVSVTLPDNVESLKLFGTGNFEGTGNALANVIEGNAGSNVLDGSTGADALYGYGGDDVYFVDDAGDRVLEYVNGGIDRIEAAVSYTLQKDVAVETLGTRDNMGTEPLNLTGNNLANAVIGNAGDNILDGGFGADVLTGGHGNDVYVVDDRGDVVVELSDGGVDTVRASLSYILGADVERLTLLGADNFAAKGNALANVIEGNVGNNYIDGAAGADVMKGGKGNDIYVVGDAEDSIVELVGEGADHVQAFVSVTLPDNVESLKLFGTGNFEGTGNALANVIEGNAGSNVLDGSTGADALYGYGGDDVYFVDDAGDRVLEYVNGGIDRIEAAVSYTLQKDVAVETLGTRDNMGTEPLNLTGNNLANAVIGNAGDNILDGGFGADVLSGGQGNDVYVVDDRGDVVVELSDGGVDTVRASLSYILGADVERLTLLGADNFAAKGNALANVIEGNVGNNYIDGAAGADVMKGGKGNDIYVVGDAEDSIVELVGEGADHVQAFVSVTLPDNVESLKLFGTGNFEGTGNALANVIEGNAGSNVLDGGTGADALYGYGGDDVYFVDDAGDRVLEYVNGGIDRIEAAVSYTLQKDVAVETLGTRDNMGTEPLNLTGNNLANAVIGNAGDNILDGGGANDQLHSLGGNDHIVQFSQDGRDFIDGGAGTDTYQLNGDPTAETFTLYTRAAAMVAVPTLPGIATLNGNTEIVITRTVAGQTTIISELDNIEEIMINTLDISANDGNGAPNDGGNGGDVINIVGDFTQTSLDYSTITIGGTSGNDVVDISQLTSAHRIVFRQQGGDDSIIGALRPQDVILNADGVLQSGDPTLAPTGESTTTPAMPSTARASAQGEVRLLAAIDEFVLSYGINTSSFTGALEPPKLANSSLERREPLAGGLQTDAVEKRQSFKPSSVRAAANPAAEPDSTSSDETRLVKIRAALDVSSFLPQLEAHSQLVQPDPDAGRFAVMTQAMNSFGAQNREADTQLTAKNPQAPLDWFGVSRA